MVTEVNTYSQEPENGRQEKDPLFLPTPFTYGSVSLSQISNNQERLDASAYNIVAMNALTSVHRNKYGWIYLWGADGLIDKAYYPGRYKRIYCGREHGIPFFLPSQLDEVYPKPTKYISAKTAAFLRDDYIKPDMLLVSRSGTIGKCTISSQATVGKLFSDDVIRITFKHEYDLGYVYSFLHTEVGLAILQSNNYGAVIDHIEPEHLQRIPIPDAPWEIKEEIHNRVIESYRLRDQSNELIDEAQNMLYEELQLPDLSAIKPKQYTENAGFRNYAVKVSRLDERLDASYHLPEVEAMMEVIAHNAAEVTKLGDRRISKNILLPGRFKRIYVDKEHGVPFFGGKQLLQLSPMNLKYLSIVHHGSRIKNELLLAENSLLITRSGTIGRVMIVPKHWEGWVANEHCIRIIPAHKDMAGYIYAWLDTPYCLPLILRHTYGAVVDELDDIQVADVPVPLLKNREIQQEINDKVLQANTLRCQAYLKEQQALKQMNELLNARK